MKFSNLAKFRNVKPIFEINNRKLCSNQASLILHIEIYDENSNKIYGNKLMWEHSISKQMSYSLFSYFVRNALDDFYSHIQEIIH